MKRWGIGLVIAALAALVLAGCDPYPPARSADVEAWIDIGADGVATTSVFLDAEPRPEEELLAIADAWAAAITTPGATTETSVDDNGGGYPFAVVTTAGAFVPGDAPVVEVDTASAVAWSLAHGAETLTVSISVRSDAAPIAWLGNESRFGGGYWPAVSDAGEAPAGRIQITPHPSTSRLWAIAVACTATLLLLVASGIAVVHRAAKRAARYAAALAGLSIAIAAMSPLRLLEEQQAAGSLVLLASVVLPVAGVAVALSGALGLGGWYAAVVRERRRPLVFSAPPGWPEAPGGFLPHVGWRPDPAWPDAPSGWVFLVPAPGGATSRRVQPWRYDEAKRWAATYAGAQAT